MKCPVNFIALWHINHIFLLKYWRYYTVYHSPYKFSDTKAYEEKYEYRPNGMCEFFMVLVHHFLSCSLKIRPNCGLEVESLLQPTAGSALLHFPKPRTLSGDDAAEAKDPSGRGLGPILCRGYWNLRKSKWSVQPHSPSVRADSAFSAEGVVSSSVPGEISTGSWRIKATCI